MSRNKLYIVRWYEVEQCHLGTNQANELQQYILLPIGQTMINVRTQKWYVNTNLTIMPIESVGVLDPWHGDLVHVLAEFDSRFTVHLHQLCKNR